MPGDDTRGPGRDRDLEATAASPAGPRDAPRPALDLTDIPGAATFAGGATATPDHDPDRTLDSPGRTRTPAPARLSPMELQGTQATSGATMLAGRPSLTENHQRIGRYAVLSKLGEGGMGAVYSAYDEELDRRVAIKLVRESVTGDTIGHSRMQREAQALARLSHPNVVQVHDVGNHNSQVFIAMEFVRGMTLSDWEARIDPSTPDAIRRLLDMYIQAGRGLAAAHQSELVHRDFKPDNVLVGDDGRARVLDFGLAATANHHHDAQQSVAIRMAPTDLLSSELTRTGSVMGTPNYMAPEQFLARPSDARTDQFSFCVALYGALHGESPFDGNTFATRQAAVVGGVPRPPPPDTRVPAWLRAILLRGLQRRPEDRHPSMDALLAALSHDPEAARRRRLRVAALALALLTAGALVLYGALVGWSAWQHHQVEALADARLTAMEASITELSAAGNTAEVERVFSAFVQLPEHRDTEALALAWRRRAEREAAAARHDSAVDAYAASYAVATSHEQQVTALVALVRFFADRQLWDGLVQAVATLERRAPEALGGSGLLDVRVAAAVARGDLGGAGALLATGPTTPRNAATRRLVDALAHAHPTRLKNLAVVPGHATNDSELAFFSARERLERVRADLDLTPIATYPTNLQQLVTLVRGGDAPPLFVGFDGPAKENVLVEALGTQLVERLRWKDFVHLGSVVHDLDRDGTPEIYVGTGPYSRHLLELVKDEGGAWSTRQASPMLDARNSDISTLDAADLDGDGTPELVAGLGAWRAYEIHVLRRDAASGLLRTVTRHKLGNTNAVLVRRGDGPPQIAVWKGDNDINPLLFPPESPRGAPGGLHMFRLVDDRLEPTVSYPMPAGVQIGASIPLAGDLDGDGRDEVVVLRNLHNPRQLAASVSTLIFTEDPEGGLTCLPLAHVHPLALHDLDRDGDAELLIRLPADEVWILGAGAARLPALIQDRGLAAEPPSAGKFTLAWGHAEELVGMGLDAQAAAAFVDIADLAAADPPLAARALLRAGQLNEALGRDGQAAPLYARAAAEPALTEEAGLSALRAYLRRGERDAGRALLDQLLSRAAAVPEAAVRALTAARDDLREPDARIEIDFAAPLDPRWHIHQPLAVLRDAPSATLHVDVIGPGALATLPITWLGGATTIEVDLDLRRVEWGEGLEISLATPDRGSTLGVGSESLGGTGDQTVNVSCRAPAYGLGTRTPIDLDHPGEPGRHIVRTVLDPVRREASCTIIGPDGREVFYSRTPLHSDITLERAAELRIASAHSSHPAGWISADLRRITVVGATVRDDETSEPLGATRHTLVEGHLADALAALDAPGALTVLDARTRVRATFWRIFTLARLGRWDEAAAALGPILNDASVSEFIVGPLNLMMRTMPDAAAALLRAAGPPGSHRTRLADAWSLAIKMRPNDVLALQVLRRVLVDLDPADAPPGELAQMFGMRAQVYSQLRMPDRARRDFAAAIAYSRQSPPTEPALAAALRRAQIGWALDQATAALRDGDAAAARALIVDLLAVTADDALIHDILDVRPELADIRASLAAKP